MSGLCCRNACGSLKLRIHPCIIQSISILIPPSFIFFLSLFLFCSAPEYIHCRLVNKLKPPIGQPFLDIVSKLLLANEVAVPCVRRVSGVMHVNGVKRGGVE